MAHGLHETPDLWCKRPWFRVGQSWMEDRSSRQMNQEKYQSECMGVEVAWKREGRGEGSGGGLGSHYNCGAGFDVAWWLMGTVSGLVGTGTR